MIAVYDPGRTLIERSSSAVKSGCAPIVRVYETAMEQDYRLALTEHRVPDLDSVYRCIATPIRIGQHWRRRQGQPLSLGISSGRQIKRCEDKKEKREAVPDHDAS
jgi:hypothetical protein